MKMTEMTEKAKSRKDRMNRSAATRARSGLAAEIGRLKDPEFTRECIRIVLEASAGCSDGDWNAMMKEKGFLWSRKENYWVNDDGKKVNSTLDVLTAEQREESFTPISRKISSKLGKIDDGDFSKTAVMGVFEEVIVEVMGDDGIPASSEQISQEGRMEIGLLEVDRDSDKLKYPRKPKKKLTAGKVKKSLVSAIPVGTRVVVGSGRGHKTYQLAEVIGYDWVKKGYLVGGRPIFLVLTGRPGYVSDMPSVMATLLGEAGKKKTIKVSGRKMYRANGSYDMFRVVSVGDGRESQEALDILNCGSARVVDIARRKGFSYVELNTIPGLTSGLPELETIRESMESKFDTLSTLKETAEALAEGESQPVEAVVVDEDVDAPIGQDVDNGTALDKCIKCVARKRELQADLDGIDEEIRALQEGRSEIVREIDVVEKKRQEYKAIIDEMTGG
jgi:prefoldin subunit 5